MSPGSIARISFLNVSGFLLFADHGALLIDTGYGNTTSFFINALKKYNLQPEDIRLIVLTHTHFDHAGGVAEIAAITGAPVAVHQLEANYLERGSTPVPPGTRWKAKVLHVIARLFARKKFRYTGVIPNIRFEKEFSLKEYGVKGKVLHTPGHTEGSVSVILENGEAIVGDNVMGIPRKNYFPPFAVDIRGVINTWQTYVDLGLETVFPAHGRSVKVKDLAANMDIVKNIYKIHL